MKEKGILHRKQMKVAQRCEEYLLLDKIMQNNEKYEILLWTMMQEFLASGLGYKELATLIYIKSFAPSFKVYPSLIMERFGIDERTAKKRLSKLQTHQFIFAYQQKKSKILQVKNTTRKRSVFYSLINNYQNQLTTKNNPRLTTENSHRLNTKNNPLRETETHTVTETTSNDLPNGRTLSQSESCSSLFFKMNEKDFEWIYKITGISETMIEAAKLVDLFETEMITDEEIVSGILEATNHKIHQTLLETERLIGYRFILVLLAHETGDDIRAAHNILLNEISDLFSRNPEKQLNGWGVIGMRIAGKYFPSSKAYYSPEFNWWQDYCEYEAKIIDNFPYFDLGIAFPTEDQIEPLIKSTYNIADEKLSEEIFIATNGRTKKAMLTSQNLNGARLLIGAIMHSSHCEGFDEEPNTSVETAYQLFIGQITSLFQNRPSKKLFSYGFIGRQIFTQLFFDGGIHKRRSEESQKFEIAYEELEKSYPQSPVLNIIGQIIDEDVNEIFHPALANIENIAKLESLCFKYNWNAILKAVDHLIQRSLIDDIDNHQISSWGYLEGLINDELKAEYMMDNDLQPGDVFCFHREIDHV